MLVASPANPTGTLMESEVLKSLIEAAESLGITFISDEIYHRLVYEGEAAAALPEPLVRAVDRIAQNLYILAPDISQKAAIAAFNATDELAAIKAGYAASRRLLLDRLPKIGFEEIFPVDGAFYAYASVRRFTNDSIEFTRRMLAEAGGGDARRRLRPGARPRLHAVFVRRQGHRHGRRRGADLGLAQVSGCRYIGGFS